MKAVLLAGGLTRISEETSLSKTHGQLVVGPILWHIIMNLLCSMALMTSLSAVAKVT